MSESPQTTRALASLDLYEQVLPGLFATLQRLSERGLRAAARQGVTPELWRAMGHLEREVLLARDRRGQKS